MNRTTRMILVAVVIVLTVCVLAAGTVFILGAFFAPRIGFMRGFNTPFQRVTGTYASNGERIYFTGTSRTGPPITAQMSGMHTMPTGRLACATCHGADGSGGAITMMMGTVQAPNIQYDVLTGQKSVQGEDHEDHPPYTQETIKQAITQGVDPAGNPLDWQMPRWQMTDQQLNDLVDFLKTLN